MSHLTARSDIIGQCRRCGRTKTTADAVVVRGALIYCPGCNPRSAAPETGFDLLRCLGFTLAVLFAGCFLIGLLAGSVRPARSVAIRQERPVRFARPAPPQRPRIVRFVPGARYAPAPPAVPVFAPRTAAVIRPAVPERTITPAEFLEMARARQRQPLFIPPAPVPVRIARPRQPEEQWPAAPVRVAYQGTPPLPGASFGYPASPAYVAQGWAQGQSAFGAAFAYHGNLPRPPAFGFHALRR